MRNFIPICIVVNIVYIIMWFLINKIRNSNNQIMREYDNGNIFYESLSKVEKEKYWKEDTKVLNVFFGMFLIFIEGSLYLINTKSKFWIIFLFLGVIISTIITIVLSYRLKKKYK